MIDGPHTGPHPCQGPDVVCCAEHALLVRSGRHLCRAQPRSWMGYDEASYYLSADDVPDLAAALAWYEAEAGDWYTEDQHDAPTIETLPCCDTHEAGADACDGSCSVRRRVWVFGDWS